jgi:hypothetical protein
VTFAFSKLFKKSISREFLILKCIKLDGNLPKSSVLSERGRH